MVVWHKARPRRLGGCRFGGNRLEGARTSFAQSAPCAAAANWVFPPSPLAAEPASLLAHPQLA